MPMKTATRLAAGLAGVLLAGTALAQDAQCDSFPSKPLTLVTAAGPGSSMDITARQIAEPLSKLAGVSVNVVNKGGSGGSLAYNHLRSEAHDGHTVLTISRSTTMAPYTSGSDFDPDMLHGIARAVSDWEVLIVDRDSGWETIDDFVTAARAAAQPTVFSGPSVGSVANVTAFEFAKAAAFEFSYVPSPSGGEAMLGVMGGQIPAAFSEPSESWGQKEANEIRYLAVASPERLDIMPDVPTMREKGFDMTADNWRGFVVPAEVPACIVVKLDKMFQEVLNGEEYTAAVKNDRSTLNYLGAVAFTEFLHKADAEAEQIAKALGIN